MRFRDRESVAAADLQREVHKRDDYACGTEQFCQGPERIPVHDDLPPPNGWPLSCGRA
jgi:hypothetical protein